MLCVLLFGSLIYHDFSCCSFLRRLLDAGWLENGLSAGNPGRNITPIHIKKVSLEVPNSAGEYRVW